MTRAEGSLESWNCKINVDSHEQEIRVQHDSWMPFLTSKVTWSKVTRKTAVQAAVFIGRRGLRSLRFVETVRLIRPALLRDCRFSTCFAHCRLCTAATVLKCRSFCGSAPCTGRTMAALLVAGSAACSPNGWQNSKPRMPSSRARSWPCDLCAIVGL